MAVTQNYFTPERNYAQNPSPGRVEVKLAANAIAYVGTMLVTVSGYGVQPAAANAGTGKMMGIVENGADNTGGAAGDVSAFCRSGVFRFVNDGTNPCTQATVGLTVYASDGITISTNSADGPPAGKLIGYYPNDPQGRPCEVALQCNP